MMHRIVVFGAGCVISASVVMGRSKPSAHRHSTRASVCGADGSRQSATPLITGCSLQPCSLRAVSGCPGAWAVRVHVHALHSPPRLPLCMQGQRACRTARCIGQNGSEGSLLTRSPAQGNFRISPPISPDMACVGQKVGWRVIRLTRSWTPHSFIRLVVVKQLQSKHHTHHTPCPLPRPSTAGRPSRRPSPSGSESASSAWHRVLPDHQSPSRRR